MSERNVKKTISCLHSSHQYSILMWWNCRVASLAFLGFRAKIRDLSSIGITNFVVLSTSSEDGWPWYFLQPIRFGINWSPLLLVHTSTLGTTVTGIESSLAPAPRHGSPHVFPFPSRLSPRHRTGAFLSGISSLHGARYLLLLVPICGTRCAGHDVLPLATRGPPLHRARPSNCFNSLQNV